MSHELTILRELTLLAGVSLAVNLLLRRLKVPSVVGFLLTGILIGPGMLGLVREPETVEALAEIGVVLLLFAIGLEFSLADLRKLGRKAAIAGIAAGPRHLVRRRRRAHRRGRRSGEGRVLRPPGRAVLDGARVPPDHRPRRAAGAARAAPHRRAAGAGPGRRADGAPGAGAGDVGGRRQRRRCAGGRGGAGPRRHDRRRARAGAARAGHDRARRARVLRRAARRALARRARGRGTLARDVPRRGAVRRRRLGVAVAAGRPVGRARARSSPGSCSPSRSIARRSTPTSCRSATSCCRCSSSRSACCSRRGRCSSTRSRSPSPPSAWCCGSWSPPRASRATRATRGGSRSRRAWGWRTSASSRSCSRRRARPRASCPSRGTRASSPAPCSR